jgi:hypothetical protein
MEVQTQLKGLDKGQEDLEMERDQVMVQARDMVDKIK